MDEFTKAMVRRASKDNPDLPIRMVISLIRESRERDYIRLTEDEVFERFIKGR
jgi:hypothetical protein